MLLKSFELKYALKILKYEEKNIGLKKKNCLIYKLKTYYIRIVYCFMVLKCFEGYDTEMVTKKHIQFKICKRLRQTYHFKSTYINF